MSCMNFSSATSHPPPPCSASSRRHQRRQLKISDKSCKYASLLQELSTKNNPQVAKELLSNIKLHGLTTLDNHMMSELMLCYAKNGLVPEAKAIFDEIINSCYTLDDDVVLRLVEIYGELGDVGMVDYVMWELKMRDFELLRRGLWRAVVGFGGRGEIELMEFVMAKMESVGVRVNSVSGNAYVVCYSVYGSFSEMEVAYGRLKKSRILIEEEAIRAMASAYIRGEKFYSLGKFVEDVGLGRKNVGNLLWNLLILSCAAKFKMKSMQREFVRMVESGFRPDITTFNIRGMAFSKMMLFADLHLGVQHMMHQGVAPDIVTYGCIVDTYLERRLAKNLDFVLKNMDADSYVTLATDPLVFEAMGKVEFHSSSEALMEFSRKKNWTYKELIAIYLKKTYRRNQIFWNY